MSRLARIVRWLVNLLVVLFIGTIFVLAGFRIAAGRREIYSRSEAAPSTGQFVHAADVQMFVQEDGPLDGPPVVLIHGTGAWSEIWRGTMHALASAGYRAIALDMPPFGYSTRPASHDYSDSAQARRILGTLDSLVGTYENDYYGTCSLSLNGEDLKIECGPAKYTGTVKHYDNGAFVTRFPGATQADSITTFEIGQDGKAESVTIEGLGVFTRVQEQE